MADQVSQKTGCEVPESPTLLNVDSVRPNSSSSSPGHSFTSTVKYDVESYGLFRQRVEKLCQFLWPPPKSIKHRISRSRAVAHLRANKFLRSFVAPLQTPLIERLKGGDYNSITGITLPSSYGNKNRKLILRVPRYVEDRTRPDREVATLNYVRQQTAIPVPRIARKDFSCDNPLEKPYVIQHRIPGSELEVIWHSLNHSQRCAVASELGRVKRTLLSLESPITGLIEAAPEGIDPAKCPSIVPLELGEAHGGFIEEPESETFIDVGPTRARQTTIDFFDSQFRRWRAVTLAQNCGEIDREVDLFDNMLKVAREMDGLGLFEPALNCLCHIDLHARNIMVQIRPDSTLEVTAILDWDEAIFAPKFVNCEPPWWLWDWDSNSNHHIDEKGLGTWPYEMAGANDLPSTLEQQELKRVFEEHAGPEYLRLAYDEPSRFGRALFRIAKDGLPASHYWWAAERIIREWEVLRQSLTH
ncbi:hypothetical protein MMC28_010175 [Mycoblastus sanguinarius]|nr:hypothetical protein [Mycoblastus sanguinarius]